MSTINIDYISPANLSRFKSKADQTYAAKAAVDTLIGTDTGKSARAIAAEELAAQLIPANAQEALNTLAEVAAWIQSHPEDAAAINEAITALQTNLNELAGRVTTTEVQIANLQDSVAGLGAMADKDTVSEADLDTDLAQKVNAASEGNHAHSNKTVLDGVTAEKVAAWDAKADVSDIPTFTEATDAQIDAMFA